MPRSQFLIHLFASAVALAISAAWSGPTVPIAPIAPTEHQAAAALLIEDSPGVDATIRGAMEAERQACQVAAGGRLCTACEAR